MPFSFIAAQIVNPKLDLDKIVNPKYTKLDMVKPKSS